MTVELKPNITQAVAEQMLQCTHQPVSFHGRIIMNLDFSERDLSRVFFAGIWIENTSFKMANCNSTSFHSSFLENVDFSGADLTRSIFKGSTLSGCNLKGIKAVLWKKIYLWIKNS